MHSPRPFHEVFKWLPQTMCVYVRTNGQYTQPHWRLDSTMWGLIVYSRQDTWEQPREGSHVVPGKDSIPLAVCLVSWVDRLAEAPRRAGARVSTGDPAEQRRTVCTNRAVARNSGPCAMNLYMSWGIWVAIVKCQIMFGVMGHSAFNWSK